MNQQERKKEKKRKQAQEPIEESDLLKKKSFYLSFLRDTRYGNPSENEVYWSSGMHQDPNELRVQKVPLLVIMHQSRKKKVEFQRQKGRTNVLSCSRECHTIKIQVRLKFCPDICSQKKKRCSFTISSERERERILPIDRRRLFLTQHQN